MSGGWYERNELVVRQALVAAGTTAATIVLLTSRVVPWQQYLFALLMAPFLGWAAGWVARRHAERYGRASWISLGLALAAVATVTWLSFAWIAHFRLGMPAWVLT